MKINKIFFTNYRNYENLNLTFSPVINFIYGNNGSGKTNLVEAIYILALSKSFRTTNDRILIKKGNDYTKVKGEIQTYIKTNYEINITSEGKTVKIDDNKINKLSDYISKINIILYNPEDSKIINESPSVRRKLLNIEISQLYQQYLVLLSDYTKLVKNRNIYLKQIYINGTSSKEYLDILTKKVIDIGLKICDYRKEFINEINKNIGIIYQEIFKSGNLVVKYKSSFLNKTEDELVKIYQKNYSNEMMMGKTLFGIHHDDLEFVLDGNKIKEWGSVGQQKNCIISFKLAEILLFKKIKKEYPILILDDLFSELDDEKIFNILKILNNQVQTFITCTSIKNINFEDFNNFKIFNVNNSVVKEE